MAKKRFTDEQIINFLREAEIFISQGKPPVQYYRADILPLA